jgi:hypothetical protein
MIRQEAHDGGRLGGSNPLLRRVQLQHLDRAPDIIDGAPLPEF